MSLFYVYIENCLLLIDFNLLLLLNHFWFYFTMFLGVVLTLIVTFQRRLLQGCHLAFKKVKSAKLGLYLKKWNNLPILPPLDLFWMLMKIVSFRGMFRKNMNKNYNMLRKYQECLYLFKKKFFEKNWPLFGIYHLWYLGLFETAYGQFFLDLATLVCCSSVILNRK